MAIHPPLEINTSVSLHHTKLFDDISLVTEVFKPLYLDEY